MEGLKVISIGSDRNLFVDGSAVSERIREYGALVDELHIIVFTKHSKEFSIKKLENNIWVYPTDSISRWFYIIDAISLGKKLVFERKFVRGLSLITVQDPFECGYVGLKIKKEWRIPMEVQVHTDPFSPYFKGWLNSIRKTIAKRVIKHADTIRVVSKSVGDKLKEKFSLDVESISLLPIYIDRERIVSAPISFDLRSRFEWKFILLCVARLSPEKNLELAFQVLAKIRPYFPSVGLVIAGSGPEEARLKARVKQIGISNNVAFVGWQENLASYYRTANVFLQTSYFEGYGMALIEAGLSGLPIVSTPVGIANDFENGKDLFLCPQNDPDYMFKAVYDLLENNQKRETFKLNMKHSLETKLISKEEYLEKMDKAWKNTAKHVLK